MANRQVRLDPELCGWVEECAYDWDCSLSAATNRLLRALRDQPEAAPEAISAAQVGNSLPPTPEPALAPPRRLAKGANPRLAAILSRNAGR